MKTPRTISRLARGANCGCDDGYAQRNPLAVWNGSPDLTLEEYLSSRSIYEPMCLYDADMPVSGAMAFVMTTADRAMNAPHAAYLSSFAVNDARRLFEGAEISPHDVQVAQLYDGFSLMVWDWLERLGFCAPGEAHAFTQNGRISRNGPLPLNTFGGALGEGRSSRRPRTIVDAHLHIFGD